LTQNRETELSLVSGTEFLFYLTTLASQFLLLLLLWAVGLVVCVYKVNQTRESGKGCFSHKVTTLYMKLICYSTSYSEDGRCIFFRNKRPYLPNYTVPQSVSHRHKPFDFCNICKQQQRVCFYRPER